MNLESLLTAVLMTAYIFNLSGQDTEDPVLFRVGDQVVSVSEFEYIYNKNNGNEADYSEESLREYLDLYKRFKLKVQAAKDLKLDTLPSLEKELAGYREQLSKSYLVNKQVTNKLTRELYNRMKKDVSISHILLRLPSNTSPSDTMRIYDKAREISDELQNGKASFEQYVMEYSQAKNVQKNTGKMGYVTAKFPDGYYALETAAYETPVGEISDPVRTASGYQIIKVHDRRPARGEIEVAHILIRSDDNSETNRERIQSIYQKLEQGVSFDELARTYSEDEKTAKDGGYLGTFGINTYDREFEEAAFSLEQDSAYTKPVKSRVGWHIIQRLDKKELPPYFKMKEQLKNMISRDQRMEEARDQMIERIKREENFEEREENIRSLLDSLDKTVFSYRWKPPKPEREIILFTIGENARFTQKDFYDYLRDKTRERLQIGRNHETEHGLDKLYQNFVSRSVLQFEEEQLMEKYPEFRALIREYEEGILLFEATQRKVWNKASTDTAGLVAFHEKNRENYMWGERAQVTTYELQTTDPSLMKKVKRYIKKHKPAEVVQKFNEQSTVVTYQQEKIEKGTEQADEIKWEEGYFEELSTTKKDLVVFQKTEEILPPQPKALDEARGYIIADYQDKLEKEWLERLKNRYEIVVHEDVLEDLIRK